MEVTVSTTATSSALAAENRSLEIDGATLRCRRFGDGASGAPPLLCLQHFRGNLDNWDPALVDPLAADPEVILLDNRGVGGSTGVVPDNVEDMARDARRSRVGGSPTRRSWPAWPASPSRRWSRTATTTR
jgi:pimeloyl-ACP methyl ester carboxylesterase